MLKKIKDLTLEEIITICHKHLTNGNGCNDCPLKMAIHLCINTKFHYEKLNEEIEIEENEENEKPNFKR